MTPSERLNLTETYRDQIVVAKKIGDIVITDMSDFTAHPVSFHGKGTREWGMAFLPKEIEVPKRDGGDPFSYGKLRREFILKNACVLVNGATGKVVRSRWEDDDGLTQDYSAEDQMRVDIAMSIRVVPLESVIGVQHSLDTCICFGPVSRRCPTHGDK